MAHRHGAQFVMDWRPHARVLDRNERARILFAAEALERRSKRAGRRNGLLGYVGLQILRALMFGFLSARTGLCCPSYVALMQKTGLCKSSVAAGLARLERCGILRIVRRIVRQRVNRLSPLTGLPESYLGTVQTSSLYTLHQPGAWAEHLTQPPARPTPFPCRRQMVLLERMALTWRARLDLGKQSLRGGEKPPTGARQVMEFAARVVE